MSADDLTDFVWRHLERKLAQAGAAAGPGELRRLLSVEQLTLPGDEGGAPGERLVRFQLAFRRGEVNVELNAHDGALMSWVFEKLAAGNGPPADPAAALALAESAAQLGPGAVLVNAGYEEIGGRPIFVCQWEHRQEGILVERDYVRVLVSGESGRVFAVHRRWHTVDFIPGER